MVNSAISTHKVTIIADKKEFKPNIEIILNLIFPDPD